MVFLLLFASSEIARPINSSNYILILIAVAFGYDYYFVIKINLVFRYTRYLCYRVIDGANARGCSGHAFYSEGYLIHVKFGAASFISSFFRHGWCALLRCFLGSAAHQGNC